MTTRPANQKDNGALARLSTQLGYPATEREIADRVAGLYAENAHLVLVVENGNGTLVGWIHIFEARRLESDSFVEVGGLVVDNSYRGQGFGRELVSAAIEWASERGFERIRVRSRASRTESQDFYKKLGFENAKTQHVLDKSLV